MDLTEAEDIEKKQQEYTELYKKDLHDPDNHDGVITHLESDILEEGENGTNGESNMETYTLPYVKQIGHGNFLYDSGNSNQGSVTTSRGGMGQEVGGRLKRKGTYVYLW